jgi:hypothetical protein
LGRAAFLILKSLDLADATYRQTVLFVSLTDSAVTIVLCIFQLTALFTRQLVVSVSIAENTSAALLVRALGRLKGRIASVRRLLNSVAASVSILTVFTVVTVFRFVFAFVVFAARYFGNRLAVVRAAIAFRASR